MQLTVTPKNVNPLLVDTKSHSKFYLNMICSAGAISATSSDADGADDYRLQEWSICLPATLVTYLILVFKYKYEYIMNTFFGFFFNFEFIWINKHLVLHLLLKIKNETKIGWKSQLKKIRSFFKVFINSSSLFQVPTSIFF